MCGGPYKARDCAHRYDSASKRAKISEDSALQKKFEGKMYMLRTSGHKSTSSSTKKYQIALDSGATTHVMNASPLDGGVEVMHAPSTIKTAHLGDTMTSNLSANVGILKDVIVMEDNNLDRNLASVARCDKAGCRVVFEWGMVEATLPMTSTYLICVIL